MRTALIVFARAPVAGQAKTRLIPALGAAGAAALAERLLELALGAAVAAGFDTVELCATPDAGHQALRWCSPGRALATSARACTARWSARCAATIVRC
jgi:uncharacterized protein